MFETKPEHERIIKALMEILGDLPIGGVASYRSLSKVAGTDIANGGRHLLLRARAKTEKQERCIFEAVRGEGIKRLTPSDSTEIGLTAMRLIRRKGRRTNARLDCINSNQLTDTELKRVSAYKSGLGAIMLVADGNKMRSVAAVVDPARPIPPETILDMFRK